MPKRTKEYMLMPWLGGVVTSIDEALLSQGQLTRGDNLIFDVRGSKKKREGINHDYDTYEFVSATRASSGTTRTITGRSTALALAAADLINVTSGSVSTYNGTSLVTSSVSIITKTESSAAGLITEASNKVNISSHGFIDDRAVYYTTTGTAIGGLTSGTFYFVRAAGANDFELSLTAGGAAIDLTDDGTGTHTFHSTRIAYTAAGSLAESQTAETAAVINAAHSVVGGHDYWFGETSRTQWLTTVLSNRQMIATIGGTRTILTVGGTAWSGVLTQAVFTTYNDKLIVAVSGTGNIPHQWDGVTATPLSDVSNMPDASIVQTHIGRLWCNDKTNRDRLHFCETGDQTIWSGNGDSGALDIGVGDGDPDGIIAIFPSFKGNLFVAKRTKLYRISGYTPEDFTIELVSNGIGCVGQLAVSSVDQDDIYFMSDKGIHSLAATDSYGDFSSAYVSVDIQKTINNDWSRARFNYIRACYVPEINSVAFAVTDEQDTTNQEIWFFNIPLKSWYRWPELSCETMFSALDSDKRRLYLGTTEGRLTKTFNGTVYDVDSTGSNMAINLTIATGLIFVDEAPTTVKGFKKVGLIYRPVGPHTITTTAKIDNFSTQSVAFTETNAGALLGVDFTLGVSSLGYEVVLSPYTLPIDGYGRGIKLTITQSGINEEVEIQGLVIEYEGGADQQETRQGDTA